MCEAEWADLNVGSEATTTAGSRAGVHEICTGVVEGMLKTHREFAGKRPERSSNPKRAELQRFVAEESGSWMRISYAEAVIINV
jgi:hypothetical protein